MRVLIDAGVIAEGLPSQRIEIAAVLSGLRSEGHVVFAVSATASCLGWLQSAGFFDDEILTLSPSQLTADLLVTADPAELLAWKSRCSHGQAILWHSPKVRHIEDDPAWFRVWDWEIVRWFSRRPFHLAEAV